MAGCDKKSVQLQVHVPKVSHFFNLEFLEVILEIRRRLVTCS